MMDLEIPPGTKRTLGTKPPERHGLATRERKGSRDKKDKKDKTRALVQASHFAAGRFIPRWGLCPLPDPSCVGQATGVKIRWSRA